MIMFGLTLVGLILLGFSLFDLTSTLSDWILFSLFDRFFFWSFSGFKSEKGC